MLIPDFDRAVMGGRSHSSCATRMHGEKHTAGCGLEVASVLHNFAARLTQVPERGFTPLSSKAIATGHQVVSIWRDITVGLDVLLSWKSISHLPYTAVPHPYSLILRGLDDRGAGWNPAYMSHQVSRYVVSLFTFCRFYIPQAHPVVTRASAQLSSIYQP